MPAVYSAALKNTRMAAVLTAIPNGSYLNIYSAAAVLLASVPFASPAGSVTGSVLNFTMPITEALANASGVAASATVSTAVNGGGSIPISGLVVSETSGDIILSSTNLVASQPFTITSGSITHG